MPFETMAIDTAGNVMPCCAFDTSHALFNYNEIPVTIDEYFNSSELKKIKDEFLAETIPDGCVSCIDKEKYGMMSKRQKWSMNRRNNNTQWIENRQSPIFIEVAVSNKCNVACTTCDSFFSSGWNRYDRLMSGHPLFVKRRKLVNTSFKVNDKFMDELFETVQNDTECNIELIGGEPMFNKSVLKFLKRFSDSKLKNCLTITTNCTLITDEIINQLRQIKDLVIVCSIDATGPLYNYIRDYNFDVVENNIKKLLTLDANILVMPVFSLFNVFNIPDLILWHNRLATKMNTKIKLTNFVKAPDYASLENIPSYMVEETVEKLENILQQNLNTIHQFELRELIKTLQRYKTFSVEKQKISLQWIEKCNIIRGMDIMEIEPNLKMFIEHVKSD
jgi:sulfatase maturation enzyme AslB (radical SAM superfamily)|tara:strand:- start:1125 stop:2294 length:1170 start_codon:yes stop_codon:yes gene_type:complete